MEVCGFHLLSLNKINGAVAVQKGFILSNKAQLHLGYGGQEWKAGVEDYNSDYWQIILGFSEPSTYGAIFGGLGVLLALSRKRRCI